MMMRMVVIIVKTGSCRTISLNEFFMKKQNSGAAGVGIVRGLSYPLSEP